MDHGYHFWNCCVLFKTSNKNTPLCDLGVAERGVFSLTSENSFPGLELDLLKRSDWLAIKWTLDVTSIHLASFLLQNSRTHEEINVQVHYESKTPTNVDMGIQDLFLPISCNFTPVVK